MRVQGQHRGQMVGLLGWNQAERTPESGDAIARFAPEHAFGAQINRSVRIERERKEFRVLRGVEFAEPEARGDALLCGAAVLGERAQRSQ